MKLHFFTHQNGCILIYSCRGYLQALVILVLCMLILISLMLTFGRGWKFWCQYANVAQNCTYHLKNLCRVWLHPDEKFFPSTADFHLKNVIIISIQSFNKDLVESYNDYFSLLVFFEGWNAGRWWECSGSRTSFTIKCTNVRSIKNHQVYQRKKHWKKN